MDCGEDSLGVTKQFDWIVEARKEQKSKNRDWER